MATDVPALLRAAASKFRGPGGSIAVVHDGAVTTHAWGYANIDTRQPMTTRTLIPICSITKHMLCAVLYTCESEDPSLRAQLQQKLDAWCTASASSQIPAGKVTIDHLCDNQSGVRDYWAVSVLCGARPEHKVDMATDCGKLRELLLQSLQFEPGTEYSYCNLNFYIVARLLEEVMGRPFTELVEDKVFKPAGMKTAVLTPAEQPAKEGENGGCVGYEGDEKKGYYPAINGIEWSGDAGIVCSLDDMVKYEEYLHRLWAEGDAANGATASARRNWYRAAAESHVFPLDGAKKEAKYRMGLGHGKYQPGDVLAYGHGGALRGFRLNRIHCPDKKLSVVVLMNHEASSKEVTDFVIKPILGIPDESDKPGFTAQAPDEKWVGEYLDEDTMLRINVEMGDEEKKKGKVKITYVMAQETIALVSADRAESPGMTAQIEGDVLTINRIMENRILKGRRIAKLNEADAKGVQGRYRCDEIESELVITGEGTILYDWFEGFMGKGPVHLIKNLGKDVWVLACPRAIDSQAPNDWTLAFRKEGEKVKGVTVGCWLARKLVYNKVE